MAPGRHGQPAGSPGPSCGSSWGRPPGGRITRFLVGPAGPVGPTDKTFCQLPGGWPVTRLPGPAGPGGWVARFLVVAVTRLPVEARSPVRPGVGRLGAVRCPWGRSSLPSVAVRFLVARFLVGAVRVTKLFVSWLPSARHEVARNRRVAHCLWGRPPGCSLAGCPGPF